MAAQSLVRRAGDWTQRTQTAMASRASLKRLRDLLAAGARVAVTLETAGTLRAEVRRREWEETARRALGVRAGLHAVRDALAEADAAGAAGSEFHRRLMCAPNPHFCNKYTVRNNL